MSKAEEYRRKAEAAQNHADSTKNPEAKKAFENIARQGRFMAEYAERQTVQK